MITNCQSLILITGFVVRNKCNYKVKSVVIAQQIKSKNLRSAVVASIPAQGCRKYIPVEQTLVRNIGNACQVY